MTDKNHKRAGEIKSELSKLEDKRETVLRSNGFSDLYLVSPFGSRCLHHSQKDYWIMRDALLKSIDQDIKILESEYKSL